MGDTKLSMSIEQQPSSSLHSSNGSVGERSSSEGERPNSFARVLQDESKDHLQSKLSASDDDKLEPSLVDLDTENGLPDNDEELCTRGAGDSNFLLRLTIDWLTPIVWRASRRVLQLEDLPRLSQNNKADSLTVRFERHWNRQLERAREDPTYTPSLFKALLRDHFWLWLISALLYFVNIALQFAPIYCLQEFLEYIVLVGTPLEPPLYEGFMYWLGLWVPSFLGGFLVSHSNITSIRVGTRIRAQLMSATFTKSMRLSTDAKQRTTTGEIVNLVSNDSQRLLETFIFLNMGLLAPVQIVGAIVYLYFVLKYWCFVGVGVMILSLPIIGFLAVRMQQARVRMITHTDTRVKLTNELITAIRIVKMYAWEGCLCAGIVASRTREMRDCKSLLYYRAWMIFGMTLTPTVVSLATFISYGAVEEVNASDIFTALALYNLLRVPLALLPFVISALMQNQVSLERIRNFLILEEDDLEATQNLNENKNEEPIALQVENAHFKWGSPPPKTEEDKNKKNGNEKNFTPRLDDGSLPNEDEFELQVVSKDEEGKENIGSLTKEETPKKESFKKSKKSRKGKKEDSEKSSTEEVAPFSLEEINFNIPRGETWAVVGSVGSGKSTLMHSILGLTRQDGGEMLINGDIAYVPQEAFIQNCSVRDNILFGSEFNPDLYHHVVRSCSLSHDLEILPAGDRTEIGERGINVSGGQKQRIAIARAVYSKRSIILMDDPLSAVDVHVGKAIFENVIQDLLADKTVLLATNQLQFLPFVDRILMLSKGRIVEAGTYEELLAAGKEFSALMDLFGVNKEEEEEGAAQSQSNDGKDQLKKSSDEGGGVHGIDDGTGALVMDEERDEGSVSWNVIKRYHLAGFGIFMLLVLLFFMVAKAGAKIGGDYWLSIWTDADDSGDRILFYAGIYSAFGVAEAITFGVVSVLFVQLGVNASNYLHQRLLQRVSFAPVRFFDMTPTGRVLNRFAKDLDVIDMLLPGELQNMYNGYLTVIASLVVIAIVQYFNLIGIVPLCIVYMILITFYRHTSREMQRIESVTRSPVYSHLSESLNGISTIRAYDRVEEFSKLNEKMIDVNTRAWYALQFANQWVTMRLEFIGSLVICVTCLTVLLLRDTLSDDPGLVGLAISHAIGMTVTLNFASRSTSQAETKLNAVERVLEYTDMEIEPPYEIEETKPVESWPEQGVIEFRDVRLRYREELPLVLRGISFTTKASEKIGIVGRTGAGKSSLMVALFRMCEPEGQILIDDIDIGTLGLKHLRQSLSIIPQSPVMFVGTIRRNLDPLELVGDDATLWGVLELVGLKKMVMDLPEKLEAPVAENGENFSLGERQLIALARCLVKRPKVLLLDEASSAVDSATDLLIQKTLREQFADCTVLTIAHRLTTIMDCDRVMVLDQGHVAEFDHPYALLQGGKDGPHPPGEGGLPAAAVAQEGKDDESASGGIFKSMVDASSNAAHLYAIAKGEVNVIEALKKEQEEKAARRKRRRERRAERRKNRKSRSRSRRSRSKSKSRKLSKASTSAADVLDAGSVRDRQSFKHAVSAPDLEASIIAPHHQHDPHLGGDDDTQVDLENFELQVDPENDRGRKK